MRWTWRISAVLEQRRSDEQPVVARLLHERDDRGAALGLRRERGQSRVVEPDGDLGGEVLEQVAGQAELREHDQPGTVVAGAAEQLVVDGEVLVEQAEPRCDLGKRDPERLHEWSIAFAAAKPGERGRWTGPD